MIERFEICPKPFENNESNKQRPRYLAWSDTGTLICCMGRGSIQKTERGAWRKLAPDDAWQEHTMATVTPKLAQCEGKYMNSRFIGMWKIHDISINPLNILRYNYNPFISLYYWPEIVCTVLLYFGVGGCHLPSSWCQIIMSKNVKNHSQQKVEVKVEPTCRMIHAGWTSVTKDQEYKSFLDVGIDELSCKIRFHKAVPLKQTKTIINKDSRNIHAILQKAATFF